MHLLFYHIFSTFIYFILIFVFLKILILCKQSILQSACVIFYLQKNYMQGKSLATAFFCKQCIFFQPACVILQIKKIVSPSIILFQFFSFRLHEVALGKTHNDKFGLLIKKNHSLCNQACEHHNQRKLMKMLHQINLFIGR